jgi:hypothetical protein
MYAAVGLLRAADALAFDGLASRRRNFVNIRAEATKASVSVIVAEDVVEHLDIDLDMIVERATYCSAA